MVEEIKKFRPELKTLIIPLALDTKILEYCSRYGLSRSEFIRSLVVAKLECEEKKHE